MHITVDLETWGTGPAAIPISIGAVRFDPMKSWADQEQPIDQIHLAIEPQSCQAVGLHAEAKTLLWWMQPDQWSALQSWNSMPRVELREALEGFSMWYGEESLPTWGNGAGFDNVVLDTAFKTMRMPRPWSYKDDRCFRTMKQWLPADWKSASPIMERHSALADARWQTEALLHILHEKGLSL